MNELLISIIVPVYNAEKYLDRCLQSVLNQSYSKLQIILVDDGSEDNSLEICQTYSEKDKRVLVLHQEKQGVVAARTLAAQYAEGGYIGFVDADDWIEHDMYETLIKSAWEDSSDIVMGKTFLERGALSSIDSRGSLDEGIYDLEEGILQHHILYTDDYNNRGISSSLWDKLFKRELILPVLTALDRNICFSEDELCVYTCILSAKRMSILNKPVYHYFRNDNSTTTNVSTRYFSSYELFFDKLEKVFAESDYSAMLLSKLERYKIDVYLKGLNNYTGVSRVGIVPLLLPDIQELVQADVKKIILYGASDVGQNYYRYFQLCQCLEVIAWTDYRWDELRKRGLPLDDISCLISMNFDKVVIAVESNELSIAIKEELVKKYGINDDKIFWRSPRRIITTI